MTRRAPRAPQTETGSRLTRAPSMSRRPFKARGGNTSKEGVGRLDRLAKRPLAQPGLMACGEFGGHRDELRREILNSCVSQIISHGAMKTFAAHQSRPVQHKIDVSQHTALRHGARPTLQGGEGPPASQNPPTRAPTEVPQRRCRVGCLSPRGDAGRRYVPSRGRRRRRARGRLGLGPGLKGRLQAESLTGRRLPTC